MNLSINAEAMYISPLYKNTIATSGDRVKGGREAHSGIKGKIETLVRYFVHILGS